MMDPRTLAPPPYVKGHALLDGKVVVVTAAAGAGIGSSTAKRCLEEGAKAVVIGDVSEKRLRAVASQLAEEFGEHRVAWALCDVTVEQQVQDLFDAAEPFGGVQILINNAGLGGTKSILEMGDDEWSHVLDVTLTGTFRCIREAARRMVRHGHCGAIVSNASIIGWQGKAGMSHYSAAKAGVMALTRSAAMDLAMHGVRVNAVAPSLVMHPFLLKVTNEETLRDALRDETFGRSAEPWEVANVMVFLASDYSSYMSGEVVSVSCRHP